jgi:hypothetical protein
MPVLSMSPQQFAHDHFASAPLGHRARVKRLVRTAELLLMHPGDTLPNKLPDPAALDGLYRLARHPSVTHTTVLAGHRQRTLQRMATYPGVVLNLHDTTELDYTTRTSLAHLGRIGNGQRRGYLCHNTLAYGFDTAEVLGLANQILFRRPRAPKHESKTARARRRNRESRLWKRGAEALGRAPDGCCWVDICDRGSDLFEYLDAKHAAGQFYVVRAAQNRRILVVGADGQETAAKLFDYARGLPAHGRRAVRVQATEKQPARTAQVQVAFAPVQVRPPRQPRGEHRHEPLAVWVVQVQEVDPPPGVAPLEWTLLTNRDVPDRAAADVRVDWYSCRPVIEEFHKAQKTGCAIEALQFRTEERLQPVIALLSVVAVFLLQLRSVSRQPEATAAPAAAVVPPLFVEVLSRWRLGQPSRCWTVQDFFLALARLGGHQNRKRDGMPGWLTIWRGWTKLVVMVEAVTPLVSAKSGEN